MNYYYRGASPGSESENQAMTNLVGQIMPVISVTYHSWGEVVYYPWSWSDGSHTPDHNLLFNIATGLANNIIRENNEEFYSITQSEGRGGLALNWQYGRYGVVSFLPETVAGFDFIPETLARKNAVIAANLRGVFYLFDRAGGSQITGTVKDIRTRTPVSAEIRVLQCYSTLVDPRMSDGQYGRYRRLLLPGSYTIEVHHPNYPTKTYNNVIVLEGVPTVLNIRLGTIIPGDANDNGVLNGLDVIYLVNFLKGIGPAPIPIDLGDVNGDCQTNGLDVIYLVNYFKGGELPQTCSN
jgi:hypothetical protein